MNPNPSLEIMHHAIDAIHPACHSYSLKGKDFFCSESEKEARKSGSPGLLLTQNMTTEIMHPAAENLVFRQNLELQCMNVFLNFDGCLLEFL